MLQLGSPLRSGPDIFKSWTAEGGPYWGRACTTLHRVRLSSASSWDRSANAASVPGCSGLKRGCLSVFPPGNVAELKASPPHWGSLEQLAAPSTPEASLERLVPLVLFSSVETTAKCISVGPSECRKRLSHSVRRSAAAFQRVFSTLVSPEQALVLKQEVNTLLRKEAIEVVPPLDREVL